MPKRLVNRRKMAGLVVDCSSLAVSRRDWWKIADTAFSETIDLSAWLHSGS